MRTWGFLAASILVISCGGGGSGSPDATPDDPDAEIPDADLTVDQVSTFTLSVTVTGLAGTLVVSNGDDELTFTADATMTFATALLDDEAYAVTIDAEPTSQNCAVTGGTGTIAAANATATVTCASKAWAFPTSSDAISPFGGEIYEPQAGIADDGDAVVGYYAYDSSTACNGDPCPLVFVSERTDGLWTHPTSSSQPFSAAGYSTEQIEVAVADTGDAAIVHATQRVTNCTGAGVEPCRALYRSDRRGGVWTRPTGIDDYFSFAVSSAGSTSTTLNATGDGLVLWYQTNGPGDVGDAEQIYASEYDGGAWVGPANIDDNFGFDAAQAYQFDGGLADTGDIVVAYVQADAGFEHVYVSERRTGVWTHPSDGTDFISLAGSDAVALELAVNGTGEAIVAWRQQDGTTDCGGGACSRIYVGSIAPGARTLPASLTDSVSFAGSHVDDYRVAIDDAGNVIVIWSQSDGTASRLYRAERRGGVWTEPATLASFINPTGGGVVEHEVAMDNAGNAIIAWTQRDGTTACGGGSCDRVYVSEYRGGAWTDPDSLADDPVSVVGSHAESISIAMSDGGDAVLAWGSQDDAEANQAIYIATYQ